MAFSDLQMKVTSEFALQKLHEKLALVSEFSHSYNELEDRKGSAICIPSFAISASEFDADNNNYSDGIKGVDSSTLTLDKHFKATMKYTDRDVAETEVQWFRDGGTQLADACGRAMNNYVVGLINATNCPLSASATFTSKKAFADLFATVYEKGLDISETILALNAESFAAMLNYVGDANILGSAVAIRNGGEQTVGSLKGLYGFRNVICVPNLVDIKGALIDRNSIGVAMRYLAPATGAYDEAWKAVDPVSGAVMGFRSYQDRASGYRLLNGEILCGAKVIRSEGIVRLV